MTITSTQDIKKAVSLLQQGRIVAFPTGTSYGLAADALQGYALQRLRHLKQRVQDKTFTIFLDPSKWQEYVVLSSSEESFLKTVSGKHVTVLLKPQSPLMHLAHDGFVGLRMIDHTLMAELAQAYRRPLTATSANVSGQEPCFDPDCIQSAFKNPQEDGSTYDLSLGCILDAGKLPSSKPSTILKIENGKPTVVRPGAYSLES